MSQSSNIEIGANAAERARNRATGAGRVDDPYPRYDALRESGPVHEGTISAAFELEGPDSMAWVDRRHFSAYDWASVELVLRDGETFSSRWYEPTLTQTVGRSILQMDEPEHRRYRALVQPGFTRHEIEAWQRRWVQPAVDELLDGFLADGQSVDLYAEFCAKFPVFTIASAFGVEPSDVPHFHQLAVAAVGVGGTSMEERLDASREIGGYLKRVIDDRRRCAREDLISLLCNVEVEDPEEGKKRRLDDEDILAFARLMLPAGAGTTYRGLGLLLLGLLQNGQLELLTRERSLLDSAIEEALRWEQPLTAVSRLVTRDTQLGGLEIPAGSVVHACLAAANHDPARWEDPHRFDIQRPLKPHLTFGSGPHLCIGMHLARMEMRTAMNAILDRMPGLKLDPDAPPPWITGLLMRMPTAVPVVFDRP